MSRCSLRHLFSMPLGHTMEACSEQHSYMNTVIKGAVFGRGTCFLDGRFSSTCPPIKFSSHRMQVVNHHLPTHINFTLPTISCPRHQPQNMPLPLAPCFKPKGQVNNIIEDPPFEMSEPISISALLWGLPLSSFCPHMGTS